MSKVIVFSKQSGANRVKGVKRLRGDASKMGPEVKKYNAFETGANQQALLTSHDFVNVVHGNSVSTSVNYYPMYLNWPTIGNTDHQRVGSRINLKAFRFKGWITLQPNQLTQIRWRMVLCRLDIPANVTVGFAQERYLRQYTNSDFTLPSTTFDQTTYMTWARHNFYKKFKDVSNKDFKAKVIASGVLPPTSTYKKMYMHLSGSIAGQNASLITMSADPAYVMNVHAANAGYLPFDVTVKINDNIDCDKDLRRYYIVLECDTGYGWNDTGTPVGTNPGILINCYARTYFTDE